MRLYAIRDPIKPAAMDTIKDKIKDAFKQPLRIQ